MSTPTRPLPGRVVRPRKAGTHYVVRDAHGDARNTGRTKSEALAPHAGLLHKRVVYGSDQPTPLRKGRLWLFLFRRGWRCTLEPLPLTLQRPTTALAARHAAPRPRTR